LLQHEFKPYLGTLVSNIKNEIQQKKHELQIIKLNSPVSRIKFISKLSQLAETKSIVIHETCFSTHVNLLHQIENEIEANEKNIDAIVVNGFGSDVKDYKNEEQVAILLDALGRESSHLPVSIILCLPTFIIDIAYRRAPHFWKIVSNNILEIKPFESLTRELELPLEETIERNNHKNSLAKFEQKLEELRQKPDLLPADLLPQLLELAKTYFFDQQFEKSFEAYNEILAYQSESNNPVVFAKVMQNIGIILHIWGCYDKAKHHYMESDRVFTQINDMNGLATCKYQLGLLYQDLGEFDKAIEYFNKSIEESKNTNYTTIEINSLINLGSIYNEIGLYKEAVEKYHHGFELSRSSNNPEKMAICLSFTGRVYEEKGMFRESVKYFVTAKTLLTNLNQDWTFLIKDSMDVIEEKVGKEEFKTLVDEALRQTIKKKS